MKWPWRRTEESRPRPGPLAANPIWRMCDAIDILEERIARLEAAVFPTKTEAEE